MKQKQQKKEEVDFSTLPKANAIISSLYLNFKNPENKYKLFEYFFKNLQNNELFHLITREHIIEYAKANNIYEDPADANTKKAKDAPVLAHKEITSEELAKSLLGLVNELSVPVRKEKKTLLDKIEEQKNLLKESENYWNNVNNETDDKKKKEDKKNVPPKPDEIEIPVYDEYQNELFVVLYNYPLSDDECSVLLATTNEFNDKIEINLFEAINDVDEYVKVEEEVQLDKKGNPIKKDNKIDKDKETILKYFNTTLFVPKEPHSNNNNENENEEEKKENVDNNKNDNNNNNNENNENEEEENCINYLDVFYSLKNLKESSDKNNSIRQSIFNLIDFSYKILNEETNEDSISDYYKNFLIKLVKIHYQNVYYKKWLENKNIMKLNENNEIIEYSIDKVVKINSNVKYEYDSIGRSLIAFCADLIKEKRIDNRNKLIYTINNFEGIFKDNFDLFQYEYFEKKKITNEEEEKNNNINNNENDNKLKQDNLNNNNIENINNNNENINNNNNNNNNNNENINNNEKNDENSNRYLNMFPSTTNLKENISPETAEKIKDPESHPIIKNAKLDKEILESMSKCDINSSPFKLIINYNDSIYKISLEEKINDKYVFLTEKNFNIFLTLPSLYELLNNYYNEDTKIYIENNTKQTELNFFLNQNNINREIYNKFYIIKFFEKMLKEKLPEYEELNLFDRIYEENFDKDLFMQEINKISLFDYEIYSKYDSNINKTFIAVYYRCPKGRVYRKRKKYKYLSRPDFQNFVDFFSPEFKLVNSAENEENKTQTKIDKNKKKDNKNVMNDTSKSGFKFEIVDEKEKDEINDLKKDLNLNDSFYEADDLHVGSIQEELKYMFPSDNGVIIKKIIKTGIFKSSVSYVRKDNLTFGIKKNEDNFNEFWLDFNENTKLSVTYKDDYNSCFKNQEDPVDSNNGSIITVSLNDGLITQILPNGEIYMKKYNNALNDGTSSNNIGNNLKMGLNSDENYRLIVGKGNVIRYFALETKIFYSSGNSASIINNLCINTNNKGFRLAKNLIEENDISEREPVDFHNYFDPVSSTKTTVKEDKTMIINYPDKSTYVIHNDNTKIYISPTIKEVTHYLVEKENLPSIEIIYDEVKKRTKTCIAAGSTEALMGSDNLMDRTYNGRISKVYLPNGIYIITYKEKKSTEEFETYTYNTITLIYGIDGCVIRVSQDGDVCVISAMERKKLNENGLKKDFSTFKDVDYLFELNGKNTERKGGVYTCDLKAGKIWTKDDETNIFEVYSNGDSKCKIEGTTIKEMNEKTIEELGCESPRYEGNEFIHPEVRFSDTPKNLFPPRLFVYDNKNSNVVEYLNEELIESFENYMKRDNLCEFERKKIVGENKFLNTWIIKKFTDNNDYYNRNNVIDKIVKLPQKYTPLSQTIKKNIYPKKEIYIERKIFETEFINDDVKEKIEKSIQEKNQYKMKILEEKKKDEINENIIKINKDIQRRFIQERLEKNKQE